MELIEVKGFMLEQVFNVDEMGLHWKGMPSDTFLSKQERPAPGFKVRRLKVILPFSYVAVLQVTSS